ncbi:MAG: menaquinone biosynthesis protein [Bacteroidales bacterium]|nr:menaquinone biosynthesis protein [Bacteroidales bacterium]MDD4673562.1 menaquinone biosynthesis protein [Bacteroidales bacterium]MDY0349101.1 menaquinone biosynthesis protein [Tenuifilaceae bacterium]
MAKKIRVSAVSYLNTAPFVYGLQKSETASLIDLSLDNPAECARKLTENQADVALTPIFAILDKPEYKITTDYCIGSNGIVRTVELLSNGHFDDIKTVYLDTHSRTSVNLIKILAKYFWKKNFEWKTLNPNSKPSDFKEDEAILAIGDKVFGYEPHFKTNIDMANEWQKFTGLPMVFAVWATSNGADPLFIKTLNSALEFGIQHIDKSITPYINQQISHKEAYIYLTQNISYLLDRKKREALSLYWEYARKLKTE